MLMQIEAGNNRVTGLDDRETDECFETEFTARTNPYRGYITIIEGCDKFCAYCVVPFTRGKERSRTSDSVLERSAPDGRPGLHRNSAARARSSTPIKIRQGSMSFAELLIAVAEVPGIRRVRFTTSHPREFGNDIIQAIDAVPTLCDHVHLPVQSGSTRVLDAMQRLYTREEYLERIAWITCSQARHQHYQRHHHWLPGRNRSRIRRNSISTGRMPVRRYLRFQVFGASQHPIAPHARCVTRRRKIPPPADHARAAARHPEATQSASHQPDT